jgi:hypothetical protein
MPDITITIPRSISAAGKQLAGVDQLLTAKQWERAAIVFAFTADGRTRNSGKAEMSFKDFAAQGIRGLTDKSVVAEYHRIWQAAVDTGDAPEVEPGDAVVLPTVKWPGRQDADGQKRYVAKDPSSIARAINAMDEHERDTLTQDLSTKAATDIVERTAEDRPQVVIDQASTAIRQSRAGSGISVPEVVLHQRTTRDECDRSIAQISRELRALRAMRDLLTRPQRNEAADSLDELAGTFSLLASYFRTGGADIDAELVQLLDEAGQ